MKPPSDSSNSPKHPPHALPPLPKKKSRTRSPGSDPQRNRHRGDHHEQELAQTTGLDLVPGSGCGSFFRGDLGTSYGWFVEAKTRVGTALRFRPEWWYKALNDADRLGRPHIALIYRFTDGFTNDLFRAYPKELLIAPPTRALDHLVAAPIKTYQITTKESRIPFEEFRDVLRSGPRKRPGSIELVFTTRLRGLSQNCRLWVADSFFFSRMIKDTRDVPNSSRGL